MELHDIVHETDVPSSNGISMGPFVLDELEPIIMDIILPDFGFRFTLKKLIDKQTARYLNIQRMRNLQVTGLFRSIKTAGRNDQRIRGNRSHN